MRATVSSIGKMMMIVAIFSVACAATMRPSTEMLTLLLHVKVGVLLWATFRARYGDGWDSAWWFGFAACGWGAFAMGVPNNTMPLPDALGAPTYMNPADIAGTIGTWIYYLIRPRSHPWGGYNLAEAARFWMMMIVAGLIGGTVSQFVWKRTQAGKSPARL